MITQADVERFLECTRDLPTSRRHDIYDDFIVNLFLCVLDLQMRTPTVNKALDFYRVNRWNEIRDRTDIQVVLDRFPDDRAGNTGLAQYLWGNRYWNRSEMLRHLLLFFQSIDVVDQPSLLEWAGKSDFRRDFEGRVKGLGYAVYQWLLMRCEVDTVKPDIHTRRFGEACLERTLTDGEVVDVVARSAKRIGVPARQLDLAIWEYQSKQPHR